MPTKTTLETASVLGTKLPEGASLAERVYLNLRDRIVTLELAPGSLINEPTVMKELGVSRTPIREALLRLALEKLVSVVPRRGTFVSEVNVGNVGQIYEFRRELEVLTAAWAAERRPDSAVEEIDAMIEELEGFGPDEEPRAMIAADQRAHRLTYRLANNPYLTETLTLYYFLALRIWFLADSRGSGLGGPHETLIDVLKGVREKDPAAARKAAEAHNQVAEAAVREGL